MLVKPTLEKQLEIAIEKAMKDAYLAALKAVQDTTDKKSVDQNKVATDFAMKAKTCASDIASAIDTYIKSAQIIIPVGTTMVPAPSLVSPVGPCTGTITLVSPSTPIVGAIS